MTHEATIQMFEENNNMILEPFHGTLVQHWFDFLADLYRQVVNDLIHDRHMWRLRKPTIQLDLTTLNPKNINHVVEDACVEAFDFQRAPDKLQTVKKVLGVSLSEEHVSNLKKHILLRNVIQHNHGVLRPKDLSDLGCRELTSDTGDGDVQYTAGDRVQISPYDLESFVDSMRALAHELVPTTSS